WTNLLSPSRAASTGRNCSPAAATAVTPTSPPSTAATSTLHHWCFRGIALFSSPRGCRLGPTPRQPGIADLFSALHGRHAAAVIALTRSAVNGPHPARCYALPRWVVLLWRLFP